MSKKRKNSFEEEVLLRVEEVAVLLINGQSRREIIQHSSENWQIGDRQADEYIKRAWELIRADNEIDIDKERAAALARYDDLYSRNINISDYREARQVQADRNKLLGLNAPDRHDHTTNGDKISVQSVIWVEPKTADKPKIEGDNTTSVE